MPFNYYEVLGVSRTANASELRKAFRRLSKLLHPDTTNLPASEAAIKFQEVCDAYEYLGDSILRREYDQMLLDSPKKKKPEIYNSIDLMNAISKGTKGVDVRRPFSGGELFSLLLLIISILMCLILAIGYAMLK